MPLIQPNNEGKNVPLEGSHFQVMGLHIKDQKRPLILVTETDNGYEGGGFTIQKNKTVEMYFGHKFEEKERYTSDCFIFALIPKYPLLLSIPEYALFLLLEQLENISIIQSHLPVLSPEKSLVGILPLHLLPLIQRFYADL